MPQKRYRIRIPKFARRQYSSDCSFMEASLWTGYEEHQNGRRCRMDLACWGGAQSGMNLQKMGVGMLLSGCELLRRWMLVDVEI
jgi:hypothetical protein